MKKEKVKWVCEHCKEELTDLGHLGLECTNEDCTGWEKEASAIYMAIREQRDRQEYERLKLKYESTK